MTNVRPTAVDKTSALQSTVVDTARRVLQTESDAVAALIGRINDDFADVVDHLLHTRGRVIVCGMGKSGIIGHKIAATFMSTGTPSFHMHPGEAYHGDLGMVTNEDVFIAISNSGETEELIKLLPFLSANGNFLVALTGNASSTLASAADLHIDVGVEQEACTLQLAPTSSTTATLAMGDALAVALMEARGFGPEDFARFHPGGALGRRLLSRVEHEMVSDRLPVVNESDSFPELLSTITRSTLGLAVVKTARGLAIVTDGDLRRAMERYGPSVFEKQAADMMTRNPASVPLGTRMEDAIAKMDRLGVTALLVLDGAALVGILKK